MKDTSIEILGSLGEMENRKNRDFPGGPVAKTPCSQCKGPGFDSWSRN